MRRTMLMIDLEKATFEDVYRRLAARSPTWLRSQLDSSSGGDVRVAVRRRAWGRLLGEGPDLRNVCMVGLIRVEATKGEEEV